MRGKCNDAEETTFVPKFLGKGVKGCGLASAARSDYNTQHVKID